MKRFILSWIFPLAILLILIFVTGGCKKSKSEDVIPKLGLSYQGGIIFYIDTGEHGLIAATSDQSTSVAWWNGGYVNTGASSSADGSVNTTIIITAQGNSGSYAAKICRDYKGGGYSDWFLPSKDQLNILYSQKAMVGGFADKIYWSSTEYTMGGVWIQNFVTGEQVLGDVSKGDKCVRAVRSF